MRRVALVVAVMAAAGTAGAAGAQVAWMGAAGGVSWRWDGQRSSLVRGDDNAFGVLIGIPLDRDALLRLRAAKLPVGTGGGASMRAVALGVDYFFPGVIGEALASAGVGGYRLSLPASLLPQPDHGRWELGWYLGIGEWFSLSRRTRLTVEVTWDRTRHAGTPTLVTAMAGIAVSL